MSGLAWALLDFVWQGAVVGCTAAVLLGLLGRARPQWRYLVACGALLLCAVLPLIGMVARVAGQEAAGGAVALSSTLSSMDWRTAGQASVQGLALVKAWDVAGWREALQPRLPLVILCWSAGAALMALRLLLGLAWVRRRSRPGAYREDPAWQAVLDRLAGSLGIGRKVILGLVDDLASPVTAGCLRPLVLVPASLATGMAPQLLEALLAHELAHVRRHDYLVNLVQSAIEILLFYHPAVWWLSHRIRVERELIADDLAASALGEPRRLALALSELDLFQLSTPQLAPGAHGGKLMSRIKRLVRPQSETLNWKLALPALALALTAAIHAHAGTQPASPKSDVHITLREERGDAYALVGEGEDGFKMTGNSADWSSIKQLKRSIKGEFLWFRDGGKTWIVQDRDTLAKAHAAYAPLDRLGQQMEVQGKEMEKHGKVMESLGKEMEQAAAGMQVDQPRVRELERKMNELSRQMSSLGQQIGSAQSDKERDRLNEQMNKLGRQMNELGEQMRAAHESEGQRRARASMDEVGKRMNEAGKPMDELGKKMDVLGKQMDRESKVADKAMRGIIRDAMAKGLAQQAPNQG
jgi:beta-lactamase regulating signal transducer with metallopeptidase domain/predicted  nucleic acid-binding Zn-ribbon protein